MEYDMIVKACVDKDMDTVWEIVQDFNLYMMLKCKDKNGNLDEDMMSYIITNLPSRLMNFKIQHTCETDVD